MEYKELAKLDKEILEAHDRLVNLNNQYNELLTNLYNSKMENNKPVVSKKESKMEKLLDRVRMVYWLIFLGTLVVENFANVPSSICSIVIFGNAAVYMVVAIGLMVKIHKEEKNKPQTVSPDSNKDELYQELNEARELYHSLRKKRDEEAVLVDDQEYQEYLDYVSNLEEQDDVELCNQHTLTLGKEVNHE